MNPQKKELVHNFLSTFITALTKSHQYTTAHQEAVSSIKTAYRHLVKAIGSDDRLSFLIIDDKIVIHEEPLEDALYTSRFVRFFKTRGFEHLKVNRGVTPEELSSFMEALTTNPKSSQDVPSFPHIQVGSVGLRYRPDELEEDEAVRQRTSFGAIHLKELDLMMEIYSAVKENRQLPYDDIRKVVTDIITAIRQESAALLAFSALRVLDEYTFTHSINVCVLTLAQAMALGVEDELLHDIGVAALLHDVGKIFVPEEVLNKPGKLTDAEWGMIRQHPQKGAEDLLDNPGIPPLAVAVAYEHHMQYDFSGYPKVSEGWQQNMCSQLTAISDVFDAMRTKRIYRDSIEMKVIAEEMNNMAGAALNPVLTKNFFLLMKDMLQESES
jgi:hypothetical protein